MCSKDCVREIKMWVLVFPENFYKDLRDFLFSTAPSENGCFLLANSYKTKNDSVLLVTDVINPTKDSWNHNGEHALEPNSSFINDCVVSADIQNSSLIFVHTHPNSAHPSKFSHIDKQSNNMLFDNLSQILVDRPLGSLVFSRKGICGVIHSDGKLQYISKIKVSGRLLHEFAGIGYDEEKSDGAGDEFDRQIRAVGEQSQKQMQGLAVTVVGAGGTGSPVAVQLARMGVGKIRLIDNDIVEKTNIPRVYGSGEKDVGKPKVDVLKKHMETFSKSEIEAVNLNVTDEDARKYLTDSDVIFACTDNLTSRHVLNDISIRYFIPLIDVGCRIDLNKDGSISQATIKVQIVTPDSACLWCTGALNGNTILQESLSDTEKQEWVRNGYYHVVEKQPSIISMTTMAASMAVNKLLSLLGVFGSEYNSYTRIELKDGVVVDVVAETKNDCVCQKDRGRSYPETTKSRQGYTTVSEGEGGFLLAVVRCLGRLFCLKNK